jgi:hypothetical protein
MPPLGQKQTSAHVRVMSALPPKADIRRYWKMRFKRFARIATIGSVLLLVLWLSGSAIAGAAKEAVLLLERYWQ